MNFIQGFAKCALLAVLGVGLTAPADAAITIFTNKADFLAAVSNPGVDTYDDLAVAETASPLNRTAGAYSYVANTSGGPFFPGSLGAGDIFLANNNNLSDIILITFSADVKAVGGEFFGSDLFGEFLSVPEISLRIDADGVEQTITIDNPVATSFRGFTAQTSIASITILPPAPSALNDNPFASVNNLILAEAAPPSPSPPPGP